MCKEPLLIPGVGFEYGTVLGGYYKPASGIDMDLIKKFPYLNDIPSGEFYWLQSTLVLPSDIAKLSKQFEPDYEALLVDFEVYQKFPLPCGFPKKSGELTCEEIAINGRCGLEEFLSKPIVINRNGVKPGQYKDRGANVKLAISDWKKKLQDETKKAWDFTSNLAKNTWNKTMTMDNFMQVTNQMFPVMDFIPRECMKTICEAQRKAAGENSIKDMSSSLKNNLDASKLLIADAAKSAEKAIGDIASGIGDAAKTFAKSIKELATTFNVYKLCPRRYSDWLQDAAEAVGLETGSLPLSVPIPIDPFTQLQQIFAKKIMGGFKDLLSGCATKNLTTTAINDLSSLASWQKHQALSALRSGDMKELGKSLNGKKLGGKLTDSASNTLNFAKTINTPSFNMNMLNAVGNDMTRRLKSFTKIKNSSDAFNLLSNVRNAQAETAGFISICKRELKELGIK